MKIERREFPSPSSNSASMVVKESKGPYFLIKQEDITKSDIEDHRGFQVQYSNENPSFVDCVVNLVNKRAKENKLKAFIRENEIDLPVLRVQRPYEPSAFPQVLRKSPITWMHWAMSSELTLGPAEDFKALEAALKDRERLVGQVNRLVEEKSKLRADNAKLLTSHGNVLAAEKKKNEEYSGRMAALKKQRDSLSFRLEDYQSDFEVAKTELGVRAIDLYKHSPTSEAFTLREFMRGMMHAEVDLKNQVTKWESNRKRKKMPLLRVQPIWMLDMISPSNVLIRVIYGWILLSITAVILSPKKKSSNRKKSKKREINRRMTKKKKLKKTLKETKMNRKTIGGGGENMIIIVRDHLLGL
ncbi:hypothetical protein QYF36_001442 [Acer negundo]|nr:hypothetical protein QYF36_001442 [Acer negundo]